VEARVKEDDRESVPFLLARVSAPPPEPRGKAPPPLAGVSWTSTVSLSTRFGRAGLLVASLLLVIAVFADLLASDLPLVCRLHGTIVVLPAVTRVEETREAEWKIAALVPYGPRTTGELRLTPPSRAHPFGTDREGRDVFARVIHGTRSYLAFALAAVLVSALLGALFGALAGLFGGAVDALVSRVVESVSAFPPLVLVLGIQAAVPRATLMTLFLAIALTRWPEVARLVRGEVLSAATREYALAARALGASPLRVLVKHLLPNVLPPLVVAAAASVGAVVLTEASLDFLRVGTPSGAASWGETMSEFRDAAGAFWLLAFPGGFLVLTVVAYNLMGEALREALDPRSG